MVAADEVGRLDADGLYLLGRAFPNPHGLSSPHWSSYGVDARDLRVAGLRAARAAVEASGVANGAAINAGTQVTVAAAVAAGTGPAHERAAAREQLDAVFAPDGFDDTRRRHWQYLVVLGETPVSAAACVEEARVPARWRPHLEVREQLHDLGTERAIAHLFEDDPTTQLQLEQLAVTGPVIGAGLAALAWTASAAIAPNAPIDRDQPATALIRRLLLSADSPDGAAVELRRRYLPPARLTTQQRRLWLQLRAAGTDVDVVDQTLAAVLTDTQTRWR